MKKLKRFFCFHWRRFAWGGSAAAIGTLGTQLDKPFSQWCFIAACVCAIVAANVQPKKDVSKP